LRQLLSPPSPPHARQRALPPTREPGGVLRGGPGREGWARRSSLTGPTLRFRAPGSGALAVAVAGHRGPLPGVAGAGGAGAGALAAAEQAAGRRRRGSPAIVPPHSRTHGDSLRSNQMEANNNSRPRMRIGQARGEARAAGQRRHHPVQHAERLRGLAPAAVPPRGRVGGRARVAAAHGDEAGQRPSSERYGGDAAPAEPRAAVAAGTER
jgi:hypothetical protein